MGDLFISYARPDEAVAERVSAALAEAGFAVWRDNQLPASRTYAEVIEERLAEARAVLVLWSKDAVKSQWVRAEADYARNAGTLVQASLDGTPPPIPFNQIRFADLGCWNGQASDAGWQVILDSLPALAPNDPPRASQKRAQQGAQQGVSICVLPFENMSGDPEQDYFSDGISEDITTDLSKVSALAVIARNTAFQFKGKSIDVGEVARQLGVSHVVEGSVRKSGNRVRITAQLVDGATGGQIWAERYDRDLTDIFAIQDELSEAIVAALKIKLLLKEKQAIERRGTANVEAYNLYLMARQFWITGNYGDVRRDEIVVRTTRRAIALDPDYAKAWALLAIAQASLRYHHGLQGEDGLEAAETALEIDPTIAEAYVVRARHLAERSNFRSAEEMLGRGLDLDPDNWELNREAARLAITQRKVEDATRYFERATELDENDFHSPMMLLSCYLAARDEAGVLRAAERSLERADRAIAQDPLNAAAIGSSAGALAYLGRIDQALERHERSMIIDPDNINMPYNFACVLATRLGETERALDIIERTFAKISPALLLTGLTDPDMDSVRIHPRFRAAAKSAIERTGMDVSLLPDDIRCELLA